MTGVCASFGWAWGEGCLDLDVFEVSGFEAGLTLVGLDRYTWGCFCGFSIWI